MPRVPHPPRPPRPPRPGRPAPLAFRRTVGLSLVESEPLETIALDATGADILKLALKHEGETYVFGQRVPMPDASWTGPWDCAEFVSWCVYQSSGTLFGVQPRSDPVRADAYTGFWYDQAREAGAIVSVEEAAGIKGAVVLRVPMTGRTGHIVISDGVGGTIEAHGATRGVCRHVLADRRWDCGILVPGVQYLRSERPAEVLSSPRVLRVTQPLTAGPTVKRIQGELARLGFAPGPRDGIFGPQTESAVQAFQASRGLVPDGEVGPATLEALEL